jgi:chaperone BCS1
MFENHKYKFSPETDVYVRLDFVSNISDNGESSYHTYTLKVFSKNNNYDNIENYVKKCVDQYQVEQLKQLETQHIFVLSSITKETNVAEFQDITFDTTKSFDNMFFEGKDDLKQRIDYFVNNEDNYKRLGIPYTFGMMFYGTPGTGKTSAIKAVAKYTNRHIIVIPIKKVKSIEVLKGVFLNKEVNGIHVDNNKRLYVFEEIDCGQWQHIVSSRKSVTSTDQTVCMQKALIKAIKVAKDDENEEDEDKLDKSINLGDFLELLDGIVEIPGRMIIMTSNHPDMLDSALIRPGRIDKVIEFKKMTRQDIVSMYKLWFDKIIPPHINEKIKDYKFTQAEIGNIFALQDSALIFNELTSPKEL